MGDIILDRNFECFEEFSHLIYSWDLDLSQLSRHKKNTRARQLIVGRMIVGRVFFGCKAFIQTQSPANYYTFLYIHKDCAPIYMLGIDARPGQLVLVRKSRESEILSEAGYSSTSFSVPTDVLDDWFEQIGRPDLKTLMLKEDISFDLSYVEEVKLQAVFTLAYRVALQNSSKNLDEEALMEVFLATLGEILSRRETNRSAYNHRDRALIGNVLAYIRQNADARILVSSLCSDFGVTERRLQKLFSEEIGFITPKSYMLRERIYVAHKMLKYMDPVHGGVSHVASQLKFSNFSKFSDSYRKVTGELPSETLKRPSYFTRSQLW